jgi:hypothetical protein
MSVAGPSMAQGSSSSFKVDETVFHLEPGTLNFRSIASESSGQFLRVAVVDRSATESL